ncbi:cytochrome c [Calditerrivibrio nitroreducens]|uniref:Cytochrome c family protein n=1 Tax=Calditerrivibrio nitroreducens (strain DSM 19672 / NBRC 101217 / Yu37-1) TaxID=768670 RepID=E4TJ24_CALNY|nr:cytochrome c [Calditerrivibrio nitroreducens]ADR19156.1 cytochrome c family protein [Calditerrivibrio nitroreducens DSM 19672]
MKKFMFFLVFIFSYSTVMAYDPDSGCVKCHSDRQGLEKMGFPQMYLDPKEVDKEVNMGGVPTCVDCHLGNDKTMNKDEAHKDMPRPFYAAVGKNHKYEAVGRDSTGFAPIEPKGDDRTKLLIRKPNKEFIEKYGINQLTQLFYHDHDNKTMAYSPKVAKDTCGKCHEKEFSDYSKSGMGLNKYQRGFTSWTVNPPGPQNCGAWFGDNGERIKKESTKNFTEQMNAGLNRGCNKCHASCNDCHYKGFEKSNARHQFAKKVENLSCYGSGKGTVCHSGPMDRRRGAGYLREEFAYPYGELPTDVHAKNGVKCTDCHKMKDHSFGHLASKDAKESCSNCHKEIVEAVKLSKDHKNVDCSSCHIKAVGAYQFTFWGPGISEGQFNYFSKHKEYYGTRSLPTLVKHPTSGIWIPVKPYPMAVMNIKGDVKNTGLELREIKKTVVKGNTEIGEPDKFIVERKPGDVNDMYIITGIYKNLKNNDNMLAWIQMDKMSHALESARDCNSCHSSHDQIATSWFTYKVTNNVKKPFYGSYIIKAGKNGIEFSDFKYTEIQPVDGRNVDDFAPFVFNSKAWNVKGIDFSIPFNENEYSNRLNEYNMIYAKIHNLTLQYKNDKAMLDNLKKIKSILPHNQQIAVEMINKLEKK